MSVTGWQIMAIKSAICSGLNVPIQAIDRSREFLKNTFREYGGSAYLVESAERDACDVGDRHAGPPVHRRATTTPRSTAAANYLMEQLRRRAAAPNGGGQKDVLVSDLYYTYYSALAMFQMGGEVLDAVEQGVPRPAVKLQETKNILDGHGRFDPRELGSEGHDVGRSGRPRFLDLDGRPVPRGLLPLLAGLQEVAAPRPPYGRRETPNAKFQVPNKLQCRKAQRPKQEAPGASRSLSALFNPLRFGDYLEIGGWDLEVPQFLTGGG